MSEKGRPSAGEKVINAITSDLIEGRLKPGDRLPTEPELSERCGVGRNAVREAVKQLEAFGVLEIRRADGTYVCSSYSGRIMDPLLYSLILNEHDWHDFVRLRAVIDIGTLHEVIRGGDVSGLLVKLRLILSRMKAELELKKPDVERLMEIDLKFHEQIYLHINNAQINTVNDYISRLTVPSRRETVLKWLETGETGYFFELHRQIYDLIENKDITRIAAVVEAHYIYWK